MCQFKLLSLSDPHVIEIEKSGAVSVPEHACRSKIEREHAHERATVELVFVRNRITFVATHGSEIAFDTRSECYERSHAKRRDTCNGFLGFSSGSKFSATIGGLGFLARRSHISEEIVIAVLDRVGIGIGYLLFAKNGCDRPAVCLLFQCAPQPIAIRLRRDIRKTAAADSKELHGGRILRGSAWIGASVVERACGRMNDLNS